MIERRYLNVNELSEYVGIPKSTLYAWVCWKRIPYAKLGKHLRFDLHQIDDWIKKRSVAEYNFVFKRN